MTSLGSYDFSSLYIDHDEHAMTTESMINSNKNSTITLRSTVVINHSLFHWTNPLRIVSPLFLISQSKSFNIIFLEIGRVNIIILYLLIHPQILISKAIITCVAFNQ